MGSNEVRVNHFQFADDALVFSKYDKSSLVNLTHKVCCFEEISGFKVNLVKSQVVGLNVSDQELMTTTTLWECATGSWPMSYLGMPLGGQAKNKAFWQPMEEKVERRLMKWSSLNISRGGKLPWQSLYSRASPCSTFLCLNALSK